MVTVDKVEVLYRGRKIGTMAPYERYGTAFEYATEWLSEGFSISPFSLPLDPGVKTTNNIEFDGLFGIFYDSLPDGWGRLLVDRMLRREGENPAEITALQRLSIVGSSGMGALEYEPVYEKTYTYDASNLDRIADECARILSSREAEDEDIEELFALGGSSGGARPKIMTEIDGEEWIVKFPASGDPRDAGLMEFEYNECARACGIEVPKTRLFPSKKCAGYFGSVRFDRMEEPEKRRIHMASASALLEVSHRLPAIDYKSLMALTWQLTKNIGEVENMYRLMCFNVYAHNRDDHSNNFSFLYDENSWRVSPAYDLTYSNSIGGEHATTVSGEGKNPGKKDLLKVAAAAGIKEQRAGEIAEEVREAVESRLNKRIEAGR